jgi:hypothetical protein
MLEVLDGQQRITSIGRFVTGKFAIKIADTEQLFSSLPADTQARLLDSTLLVYECEGTEEDINEWFQTINIVGVPLSPQERLNAIYSGPFVTKAKAEFSNSTNSHMQKWLRYIKGDPKRQEVLAVALSWVAASHQETPELYLARHRTQGDITELKAYFTSVIDWIGSVFLGVPSKYMRGLDWGRLYESYHHIAYAATQMTADEQALLNDLAVKNPKGIYEYLLGGKTHPELLAVRFFEDGVKRTAYSRQTGEATARGTSNCPTCATGSNANKARLYRFDEMEADHVTAWSRGGTSDLGNCEMLCVPHNRAKGNK